MNYIDESSDREKLGKSLKKLVRPYTTNLKAVDELISYFYNFPYYYIVDELNSTLGLNHNQELFESFYSTMINSNYFNTLKYPLRGLNDCYNFFKEMYFQAKSIKDKIGCLLKVKYNRYYEINYFYTKIFTVEEQKSVDVAVQVIKEYPLISGVVLNNLRYDDQNKIIDKYYSIIYSKGRDYLDEELLEKVVEKARDSKDVFLSRHRDKYKYKVDLVMAFSKSDLLDRLKANYGESYTKITKKDINNHDEFILALLNSNVLETIYTDPYFTPQDAQLVNSILISFEDAKIDVSRIRAYQKQIMEHYTRKERSLFTNIINNSNNEKALDEYLAKNNINRDNFSKYIRSRKFLDKEFKEKLLLVLAKHFKTDYISVYDIIEMEQEANERGEDLEIILKERGINVKYFMGIYNKLKQTQPEVYNLIHANVDRVNKRRLRVYYSIKNDKIKTGEEFINKFKKTPEEILELFEGTPLYDEVYESLLKWHDFNDETPDRDSKGGKKGKK